MQFKHPELLYALLLLVVPILIHLFQLRRFQKVKFTNVKLLKQINLQTRKSSQLKKWLVLVTRMLTIFCAVLAFAQPFIPNTTNYNESQETVVYLDNSFSMQAKGKNGSLLNEAIETLLLSWPENDKITVFTNDETFKNTTIKAIKNELIGLSFSNQQLNYDAALLKGKQLFSKNSTATKNLIVVSDFQQKGDEFNLISDSLVNTNLVQLKPNVVSNISIDSVYIKNINTENLNLAVVLTKTEDAPNDISISLFNDEKLLAKNVASFLKNTAEVDFTLPNVRPFDGKLTIEDIGLTYDNSFYFNLNKNDKIKVLNIFDKAEDNYLNRIYTDDEFEFASYNLKQLNYNLIPVQNLVILNELESIPESLQSALLAFNKDGNSISIVPSNKIILNTYNKLFRNLNQPIYSTIATESKRITAINFEHPLLENTFYAKITNFQYPKTDIHYKLIGRTDPVFYFDDSATFLHGKDKLYTFASPLNQQVSNFTNSQLIVPAFYNMGIQSLPLPNLYYTVGNNNTIAIKASLGQDEILSLQSSEGSIIPLQTTFSNSVVLQTGEFPENAGILSVINNGNNLQKLSFNYPRNESNLVYLDVENSANTRVSDTLKQAFDSIKSNANVNALWKWFVIFALAFLLLEMLLLKYLK